MAAAFVLPAVWYWIRVRKGLRQDRSMCQISVHASHSDNKKRVSYSLSFFLMSGDWGQGMAALHGIHACSSPYEQNTRMSPAQVRRRGRPDQCRCV